MKIKSESNITGIESEIMDGTATYGEYELSFEKRVPTNNKNVVFPLYQKRILGFEYDFLKGYYYALYTGVLKDDLITIQNFNALASLANPIVIAPHISRVDENGLAVIENDFVFVNLKYKNAAYQVTIVSKAEVLEYGVFIRYFVSVLGIESDAVKNNEVVGYSVSEAIRNSYYKNKILSVKAKDEHYMDIEEKSIKEYCSEKLKNIFIPTKIKEELERFHLCVNEFDNIGFGLRYLLCGEPGTGKTKTVRTLINMCYKKATIIIVNGKINFKALFSFAKLLEPAIICIDDIDLKLGSRQRDFSPDELGSFLQQLDGFDKNSVFLLATSNDKAMIDMAAQRPGRFDLLIDYSKLEKKNYMDIISANCKTKEVLESFDNTILNDLKDKKVSGAFIVNLIKQLEIKIKLNNESDIKKYIYDFIDLSFKGFYKNNESEEDRGFGFRVDEKDDGV